MRWTPGGRSRDLEDRRGQAAGGGFGMRGAAPIGLGGLAVLVVLSLLTGQNFLSFIDPTGGGTAPPGDAAAPITASPEEEKLVEFVSFVLDDSQNTWTELLGNRYERARLVLFRDAVSSACGMAESATGPFYCPADRQVYIDLGFYEELARRFKAGGDFAQAYVLAHEIGHHVQTLVGTESQVRQAQRADPARRNDLSVRMELQADCYAGVWGHSAAQRDRLEPGDVEEGLNAAAAIGDDRIQRMGGGRVAPESFTHGSSADRVAWFRRGLESGDPKACDTFSR
jgi:predicted metalloprotease